MREAISLNDGWQFAKWPEGDMERLPLPELEKTPVTVPHTWYEDGNAYEGIAVYERTLELNLEDGKQAYLEFLGADRWCRVYADGCLLGEHKGAYSTFRVPFSNIANGKLRLTVILDNRNHEEISPLAGDFTIYGGLYRDVNLILVEECHFDLMYHGTSGLLAQTQTNADGSGILTLEPHVCGAMPGNAICYELYSQEGELVWAREAAASETVTCRLEQPVLWNGKKCPYQYKIRAVLLSGAEDGHQELDTVQVFTGFRHIRMDADQGFFLNGEHLRLNGVAKHQDSGTVFSAAGPDQWNQDMEIIRELGANAVRLSHYQHPQYFYDLCDQEGLVVWAEIPMLKMNDGKDCLDNACSQLTELILQNLHHPSICFWGIQNEIAIFGEEEYMHENCRQLSRLAKELDPGRLVTAANLYTVKNDSQLNRNTDMIGYNIYFGWYYGVMKDYEAFLDRFHEECPGIPLGISEYGVDCSIAFHQKQPKVKDYSEEYQSLFHETVYEIFQSREYLWGSFVWNLFDFGSARRDEGGTKYRNCKGLVTFDRRVKKDAFYYYKAQWSEEPFVYIAERRFEKRAEDEIPIKVYSNQPQVTLQAAGETRTLDADNGVFLFEHVPLVMGENMVMASAAGCTDQATFFRAEEPEPSYTFVDPNPEINVRNWFLDEKEEEEMFPKNHWSVMDPVSELLLHKEAMEVIEGWSEKLAQAMRQRKGSMPLYRMLNYMRGEFKEEDVKELNQRLTLVGK